MREFFVEITFIDIARAVLLVVALALLGYIAFKRRNHESRHRVMDDAFVRSNVIVLKNALNAMNGTVERVNAALAEIDVANYKWGKLARGAEQVLSGLDKLPSVAQMFNDDAITGLYGKCLKHFGSIAALTEELARNADADVLEQLMEKLRKFAKSKDKLLQKLDAMNT